jgi:uncharacterized protein
MAPREETTRMCALRRVEKPVAELIRFVLGPDGVLVPDTEAKAEGRGVWISLSREDVAEAVRKKVFARSLKTEIRLPDDLPGLTRLRLEQRYAASLSMARKAGQLVWGATKVRALIESGALLGLITASDAADDGRSKMVSPLRALNHALREDDTGRSPVPHFELLTSEQLGLALGLDNVIHAALTSGAAAQSAMNKASRLALYIASQTEENTGQQTADGVLLSVGHDERR